MEGVRMDRMQRSLDELNVRLQEMKDNEPRR